MIGLGSTDTIRGKCLDIPMDHPGVPPMTDRTSAGTAAHRSILAEAISRRGWIAGTLLSSLGACGRARGSSGKQGALSKSEQDEIAKVEELARKAGIGPFAHSQTEHLIGLGDAPAAFRQSALEIAESFAKVFVGYFRSRGFKAELPSGRMTVVTLKDAESYRAMLGEAPGMAVGGHYDLDTNRLVMFDLRGLQAELATAAERINTLTLVHETAHLLCFNMGILSRQEEVPVCVSEGLATFFELWRPKARSTLGGTNKPRLSALWDARNNPKSWIPLLDLLKDDKWFDEPNTEQLAYGESWLLVHYLLKKEAWLPKFRAYLEGLKAHPQEPLSRINYAESKLGPLAALDRELRKHARDVLGRS
jgi:hypothetical protein